jgi:hypothetical protein
LQFDGSGDLTVRYFVGAAQEQVTSLNEPRTVYWMATDDQGSVRDVVDNNGNLVDHIVYTTVGQTAYESNLWVPHWTGYVARRRNSEAVRHASHAPVSVSPVSLRHVQKRRFAATGARCGKRHVSDNDPYLARRLASGKGHTLN